MSDQAAGLLRRLWAAVTAGPGALPASERLAIAECRQSPSALSPYVDAVRAHAYQVTDGDVAVLKQAGYSEEQIFEATVAAAVGAGFERMRAAEKVLGLGEGR